MANVTKDGIPVGQRTQVRVVKTVPFELVATDYVSGEPLADWRIQLELPDGEQVEGVLDAEGSYRRERVLQGDCKVILLPPEGAGSGGAA